jgi:hypothetical protein
MDPRQRPHLHDELIGLDSNDPEVRAFCAHLDRTHRLRPTFTVEGYLAGISDFAESANRAQGGRRVAAVLVASLLLLGAALAVWDALAVLFG